jgi:hypothetical protein
VSNRKYTVANPPRVHEVARACGMSSKTTIVWLYVFNHSIYRTPSHKVPLSIAIAFLNWLKFGE